MTKKTALYQWHEAKKAKIVDFAGYLMPVQYSTGIMKEHLHTRSFAGLFDVSHMGQVLIKGENIAQKLEKLLPADFVNLSVNQQRYSFLTNEQGGIDDDLMITKRENDFYVVVNAACKEDDFAKLQKGLSDCDVSWWEDRALLALQGPKASEVLAKINPKVADLAFMRGGEFDLLGESCWISRSGYTGEDGFEISLPNNLAVKFADLLCLDELVLPIGLGARDSLRLEAGLCLYGNDIDQTTSPIEADLLWAIQKVRRLGGERESDYVGADVINQQLQNGVSRIRCGFLVEGKIPVRARTKIICQDEEVGEITSGGFAPSLNLAVAMGYLRFDLINSDKELFALVRGKKIALTRHKLPFIKKSYQK